MQGTASSCLANATLPDLLSACNQAKIARLLGITRGRVNRWANGRAVPEVQHLPRLAKILRIDVADLTAIIAADVERARAEVAS